MSDKRISMPTYCNGHSKLTESIAKSEAKLEDLHSRSQRTEAKVDEMHTRSIRAEARMEELHSKMDSVVVNTEKYFPQISKNTAFRVVLIVILSTMFAGGAFALGVMKFAKDRQQVYYIDKDGVSKEITGIH